MREMRSGSKDMIRSENQSGFDCSGPYFGPCLLLGLFEFAIFDQWSANNSMQLARFPNLMADAAVNAVSKVKGAMRWACKSKCSTLTPAVPPSVLAITHEVID
jgi:hypothetical protein